MQNAEAPTMGTKLKEDGSLIGDIRSITYKLLHKKIMHRLNKSLVPKMKNFDILTESPLDIIYGVTRLLVLTLIGDRTRQNKHLPRNNVVSQRKRSTARGRILWIIHYP
ncbi:hypothetical protein AVEN_137802-1 [Araneus ventricosus]|uniref:Uncharacterized protein n=1 Tax=Araneus ventricosus TaxID=182803 RepID=A0A4Y2PG20_ARAVE|nr:hypothetical protein AVEN_137802-1 [Araneus ventricosus]